MSGACAALAVYPGLVCEATARISDHELQKIRRRDLPSMIEAAGVSMDDVTLSLGSLDDDEVFLLARIVRRCCQKRLDSYRQSQGKPGNWRDAI
jgi:hypothetical protein